MFTQLAVGFELHCPGLLIRRANRRATAQHQRPVGSGLQPAREFKNNVFTANLQRSNDQALFVPVRLQLRALHLLNAVEVDRADIDAVKTELEW